MQEEFVEEVFTMRTDASYKQECADIEQVPTEAVRNDLRTTYGINRRSAHTEPPGFQAVATGYYAYFTGGDSAV